MENKSEQRKQHKKNPHYAEQNYLHFLFLTVRRLKLISPTHDAEAGWGWGEKNSTTLGTLLGREISFQTMVTHRWWGAIERKEQKIIS